MKRWTPKELDDMHNLVKSRASISEVKEHFDDRSFNSVHVMWKRIRAKMKASNALTQDVEEFSNKAEQKELDKKYKIACNLIKQKDEELKQALVIKDSVTSFTIPKKFMTLSEAMAFIVASDWHIEELVRACRVNYLNEFNLKLAEQRSIKFFQNSLTLVDMAAQYNKIDTIYLALLGDFISGNIHPDIAQNTELGPMSAIIKAQELIISGIKYLLKNSKYNIIVGCVVGNHSRTTEDQRVSTEFDNSLETFMYHSIKLYFQDEPRVIFHISEAYHLYEEDVMGYTLRFHHGHAIKYQGGIGGLFIPTYKKIANWNVGHNADYDIFGHHHQFKFGGNFISNGSLIGYSPYAIKIGAPYEPPRQTFFIIKKGRGITSIHPIFLEDI